MVSLIGEGGHIGIFLWVRTPARALPIGHQKKTDSSWASNDINRGHNIKVPGRGDQFESDRCSIALGVRRIVILYLLQSPFERIQYPGRADMTVSIGEAAEG